MIPDSIKCHKPGGTEIRQKNGHYYVYKVEGYYDKKTKKSKCRSLGCIGKIYEGIGFVPNKKEAEPVEYITKEYGATRIIMASSQDILAKLREYFPTNFIRIYVMAVLKLLGNIPSKDMDVTYTKSAISVILPEVHLSKNTVSSFLSKLSLHRSGMLKFMREYTNCDGGAVIFDGSSFINGARLNPFSEKGYLPGHIEKSQIRLIYAYSRKKRMPIYFLVAPGGMSDKAAFETALDEIGVKGCLIILDKGFFSSKNISLVEGTDFILPLMKNTSLVPNELKRFSAYEKVLNNCFSYHKRLIYHAEINQQKYEGCKVYTYYDNERRQYLMENYMTKKQDKDGLISDELMSQVIADTECFGVTMLLTKSDASAKDTYLNYKTRWEIEEMFDAHKNTLGFDMKYETSYSAQEGWAFIEFLALLIYHKVNAKLVESELIKRLNVKDVLFRASTITQSKASGSWKVCNLTKPLKDILTSLYVSVEIMT